MVYRDTSKRLEYPVVALNPAKPNQKPNHMHPSIQLTNYNWQR